MKDKGVVGPRMRAVAASQSGQTDELATKFRSLEKAALFEELARSLASKIPVAELEDQKEQQPVGEQLAQDLIKLLADVATGLWRLRLRMLPLGTSEPSEENRRSYKQLESVLDILTHAGLQLHDHTGEAVPSGGVYTLKVLAYEPSSSLTRELVIETIKPTIYFRNKVIQTGEVIVGTPSNANN